MPVVGQRYKSKTTHNHNIYKLKRIIKQRYMFGYDDVVEMKNITQGGYEEFRLQGFFNIFEELPDSNSQKPEEVQIGETYTHLENGANYRLAGIDSGNHAICIKLDGEGNKVIPIVNEIPTVDKFWQMFERKVKVNETPNSVDLEQKEVNEVERALGELKNNSQETEEVKVSEGLKIKMSCAYCSKEFKEIDGEFQGDCECYNGKGYVSSSSHIQKEEVNKVERALEELKEEINYDPLQVKGYVSQACLNWKGWYAALNKKAQNLVTALEAEKSLRLKNDQKLDTKEFDSRGLDTKQDMSKPEPEIDMKEECVEPVSIWKDVSELPEYQNYHVIGKMKDGKCIFGFPYQLKDGVSTIRNIDNIGGNDKIYFKCFSTLTDFVNQVEDMEARLRKLEGK